MYVTLKSVLRQFLFTGSPRPANTTAMPAHSADEEVQQTEPSCTQIVLLSKLFKTIPDKLMPCSYRFNVTYHLTDPKVH